MEKNGTVHLSAIIVQGSTKKTPLKSCVVVPMHCLSASLYSSFSAPTTSLFVQPWVKVKTGGRPEPGKLGQQLQFVLCFCHCLRRRPSCDISKCGLGRALHFAKPASVRVVVCDSRVQIELTWSDCNTSIHFPIKWLSPLIRVPIFGLASRACLGSLCRAS